jgi:hypothetical protein
VNEHVFLLLIGLNIKHFIADYLLQFPWMIAGKGSFRMAGGYVHATIHVTGTAFVLWLLAIPSQCIAWLVLAEFVLHYLLDFAKIHYSKEISSTERPNTFWALNGLDQLLHQLTYVAIVYIAVTGLPF